MKRWKCIPPLLALALLCTASLCHAEKEIRLSAAASLNDAIKEAALVYAAAGRQVRILPNFGPSGALAKQINEGAPTDLFISANEKWMTYLHDEKKVDTSSEKILVANTLVFIGVKNPAVTGMADLLKLKQIAIGSPKSVPAGEYAAQAMKKAGIYKQLQEGQKLILAKDVRQALAYADRGEAEGAFVYKTDALLATHAVILFTVPQDLYAPVNYPVALTLEGAKNPEAKAFYAFLTGPEGLKIFARYGFSAPN